MTKDTGGDRVKAASNRAPSVMIVGHWRWDIFEEALSDGLRALGCIVEPFRVGEVLPPGAAARLQARLKCGPALTRLNRCLLERARAARPAIIFLYTMDLIYPSTIRAIKTAVPGAVVMLFHNDNPVAGLRNRLKWRHFLRSIPEADVALAFRPSNLSDFKGLGASRVEVLPPHYLTKRHRAMPAEPSEKAYDVVFVGHYEADGRDRLLDHLVRSGFHLGLFGTGWHRVARHYGWMQSLTIEPVRGDAYARVLSSSRMALALLSAMNRDVWTYRSFEIPACGTLMLAPRTAELEAIFRDGREAVYYDSAEDLVRRMRHLLAHPEDRDRIARAGMRRCVEGGHHEIGRAARVIEIAGFPLAEWATGRAAADALEPSGWSLL